VKNPGQPWSRDHEKSCTTVACSTSRFSASGSEGCWRDLTGLDIEVDWRANGVPAAGFMLRVTSSAPNRRLKAICVSTRTDVDAVYADREARRQSRHGNGHRPRLPANDRFPRPVVECIVCRRGGETMTTTPPFRAEQVGSLLRPIELREARARAKAGALSATELRAVEDRCIRAAVARQESVGLSIVTDGEFRRDFWHLDFLCQLEGVSLAPVTGVKFEAEDVRRCRRSPARFAARDRS
jgi:hypothetical protein